MTIIKAKSVDTWLGDHQILFNVSMKVNRGEVVALLGGNGSGKTTLLRTLLGLIPHQGGSVELFDTQLANFRNWSRIGYVPQRARLSIPNATVNEIVMLGRLSQRHWFLPPSRQDKLATRQALARVGLEGMGNRTISQLSGGQQQRALIARALASQADLLILDEPLAALDVATQVALAKLLSELNRQGLTILTVLHELGAMEKLLTRCVVLQLGRLVHDGPLLAGPPTDNCIDTYQHQTRTIFNEVRG